jgi:hypothetical protein
VPHRLGAPRLDEAAAVEVAGLVALLPELLEEPLDEIEDRARRLGPDLLDAHRRHCFSGV